MIKKLVTVKEYCKIKNVTDGAVRKQISTGKVTAVEIDDLTHIVIESNEVEVLKTQIRSAKEKIKTLEAKLMHYTDQSDKIERMEARIATLEDKLDQQYQSKEALYEKVISHMTGMLPAPKE